VGFFRIRGNSSLFDVVFDGFPAFSAKATGLCQPPKHEVRQLVSHRRYDQDRVPLKRTTVFEWRSLSA
jgi:hypothetical protein